LLNCEDAVAIERISSADRTSDTEEQELNLYNHIVAHKSTFKFYPHAMSSLPPPHLREIQTKEYSSIT